MKPILMKAMICFIFFLLVINTLFATAINWTGDGDGVYWSDPANWNTGTVPVSGSYVELTQDSGEIYYDMGYSVIANLIIESGSELQILADNILRVRYNTNDIPLYYYAVDNHGILQNNGELNVYNAEGAGIRNNNTIDNYGLLNIFNLHGSSIFNLGEANNFTNGRMHLRSRNGTSINSIGSFYNDGEIHLYEHESDGGGIHSQGDFINNLNGEILFGASNRGLIVSGYLENAGLIEFEDGNYSLSNIDLRTNASFLNKSSGDLIINSNQNIVGISILAGCFFTNMGQIEFNNNGGTFSAIVIFETGTFVNMTNGNLEIQDVMDGLVNLGEFENNGIISISNADTAIINNSLFKNQGGGLIEVTDILSQGIDNSGHFINEDATLSFHNMENIDILNYEVFENLACGDITLDGWIDHVLGTFSNYGWLSSPSEGLVHAYSNDKIINYGFVIDPHNRFVDALDNFQTRIVGLENVAAGTPITDAFDVFNTSKAIIEAPFFTFPQMQYAGYYNHKDNIYFPNENVGTSNVLTFNTTIGDCSKVVQIPVEHASFKSVEVNQPNHNSEEVSLYVFPNPTTDGIQVNLNHELKADGQLELMNPQGKIVHSIAIKGQTSLYVELLDYPAGTYFLRVKENGKVVYTEKVGMIK